MCQKFTNLMWVVGRAGSIILQRKPYRSVYRKTIQFRGSNDFRTRVVELSEHGETADDYHRAPIVSGYAAVILSHPKA